MTRRIVSRFHPQRVILFGSWARGTAGSDSDIDLLVIMPVKGSRHQARVQVGIELDRFRGAKDILVATPEDAARARRIPGSVVRVAQEKGEVLYAAK
jgi:predicted nucleotidyltransferase